MRLVTSYNCIVPPHMLRSIAQRGDPKQQEMAWLTLTSSEQFRGQRLVLTVLSALAAPAAGAKRRTVYDGRGRYSLPGKRVRGENEPRAKDPATNEAFEGSGVTYDLFSKVFERNSIDDRGMRLESTVHYGQNYDNGFWNGRQMVYGDGDGKIFRRFTVSIDIIGHELAHGVTQYEAGLEFQGESGALNESFSDVFGSLAKQYRRRQTAKEASWIIGEGIFKPSVKGKGIRSLKAPGTAYDDPVLGKDPQPSHMKNYVETADDNGGVHINSGIPNRAFYEAAVRLGGHAWEKAGRIWYVTLRDKLRPNSTFADAAEMTIQVAAELYGHGSKEQGVVKASWTDVGL